jgi:hypothetical protein
MRPSGRAAFDADPIAQRAAKNLIAEAGAAAKARLELRPR